MFLNPPAFGLNSSDITLAWDLTTAELVSEWQEGRQG